MEKSRRYTKEALEYISRIAAGGMRDALTLLDKCLAYSHDITLENAVKVLGTVSHDDMIRLTDSLLAQDIKDAVLIINEINDSGKDLKSFINQYCYFLIDVIKFEVKCDWKYISIPKLDAYVNWLSSLQGCDFDTCIKLLDVCVKLNSNIKYSPVPEIDVECAIINFCLS